MKSVIFITEIWNIGGIETYINNFSQELIKNYKVTIIKWGRNNGSIPKNVKIINLEIYSKLRALFFIELFIKQNFSLLKEILKNKPTCIVLNLAESSLISIPTLLVYKLICTKSKIIYQFHGSQYLEKSYSYSLTPLKKLLLRTYEKMPYLLADIIVVFSSYSKISLLIKYFNINPNKIKIIKPGKPLLSKTSLLSKSDLGLANKPILLCVSRLEKRKGTMHLLEITKKLNKLLGPNYIKVVSTIIEQDLYSTQEHFYYSSKNYPENFLYYVNNPSPIHLTSLISAATLIIVPSLDLETFGFTILEAMSLGTPVAAFDVGAISEIVTHNYNGFLRKVGDTDLLVKDIYKYFTSSSETKKTFKNNALLTSKEYSWKKYYENFFENI